MIQLSILIPTIPGRAKSFTELFNELHRQLEYIQTFHPALGHVEILHDDSKKFLEGGLSIGGKRKTLLKRAEGKYLCYVDDDEEVSGNYLETLLRLCLHNADVVTFRSFCVMEKYWTLVDMSLKYHINDQASPDFIVRRRPWHVCPVRTEFAKLYSFEDSNYGEDWDWFEKVLNHCTTETHTDAILHKYIHGKHSESDKITDYVEFHKKSVQEKGI